MFAAYEIGSGLKSESVRALQQQDRLPFPVAAYTREIETGVVAQDARNPGLGTGLHRQKLYRRGHRIQFPGRNSIGGRARGSEVRKVEWPLTRVNGDIAFYARQILPQSSELSRRWR